MKKTSLITFVTFVLGIAASILGNASCSDSHNGQPTFVADTVKQAPPVDPATEAAKQKQFSWDKLDWNAPELRYDEIKTATMRVQGNEHYGIYSLGENVLFAEGKAEIRMEAMDNLNQVIASIKQHYTGGEVRIYGFTDSVASKESNAQLAGERAEAVRKYIVAAGVPEPSVSVYAMGEAMPVSTNKTASGRAMNRRVQIVAMKD
jgi:outer membrane protein OmpA-like peptidoglycan-associated protein